MTDNNELLMNELQEVYGGAKSSNKIKTVASNGGHIVVFSTPAITDSNEVSGSELYPGDKVEVLSETPIVGLYEKYGITIDIIAVRVIKNNIVGYVNAQFIQ